MWKCYELKFKAKSPIHIGYGSRLGIINRTRYYIPGKTIWGAVTAILARKLMDNYNKELYEIVGDLVKENLIFSYFYPSREETVFYPNYTTEGFGFGSKDYEKFVLAKEEFEKEFITSYISTALEKSSKTRGFTS
ncbi:MAG: RAMP superfamily CRISPR-associated protein [Methanobacteriaceae archaeon]